MKIVDFGLAKDFAASDESSVMIGTPAHMAPEQALRKQMGPWTDLHAVGVMAIAMLTGRAVTLLTPTTQAADPWAATAMDAGLEGAAGLLNHPGPS